MKRRAWFMVGLGALLALVYAQLPRPQAETFLQNPNGQALLEVYQRIQQDYLEPLSKEKLDKLLEGAIGGMVQALEDPFTSYSPPQRSTLRQEDLRGEFFGIGATLSAANPDGTGARIEGVMKGLPAQRAGLRAGDVILEVDGEDVTKLPLLDIVAKIRGREGTKVTLKVRREGVPAPLVFELVRERVEIISVSTAKVGDVGYVALETFANFKVEDQLKRAIEELKAQGVKKLIFDLRDNGGGLLDQGCAVASAFLKEGPIVYTRTKNLTRVWCEATGQTLWDGPMVVLVNGNSASASEIVAGALQDYGRAKVIGEKTFGKGVGQTPYTLANGGELTLVTFEWLTPKRRSINKEGITPDIVVKDTRFPTPFSLQGAGAPPGAEIAVTLNGKTVKVKADAEGKFSYAEPQRQRPLPEDRGQAVLDLENDAILKRALEELNR
ncbi:MULTISPECIES: S41 family peptidase [Thermus]|jgi:carboxyl-terminal processing protease|uniref:Carboxyl-terminal protease n=1 Tax=Thermus thermophilus (strain ATCC 27634 / DSM 579 / HB8) TaxID=300852 RepID=Q5SIR8_THET8|nr:MULTISPECIES: S41 family peptidase [Thermus]QZY57891.1 S41 family peptidase [Thermus thermophilus]BAD71119.1 carboxyl-terminal protease [Thermus thermophilus HB8]BBL93822.1 peptidase S41 [Thermus thermophilus]BDA37913.1 peptidase S41 [Thermus thermophilus]BDE45638.1 peptidase S41 [Thermus thermophilus]